MCASLQLCIPWILYGREGMSISVGIGTKSQDSPRQGEHAAVEEWAKGGLEGCLQSSVATTGQGMLV